MEHTKLTQNGPRVVATPQNAIYVTVGGIRCPKHGLVAGARYQEQDPAPCGCAWVWDEATHCLVAVPSRKEM